VIFLDTGFLCALFSETDANHDRARQVVEAYRGRPLADVVVTTNHVVAETITLVRARSHRDARSRHRIAVEVGRKLFAGVFGRIHQATAEEERAAFMFLERRPDKSYSFVDCLSFVVMNRLGINEAWAVDSDFTHHGFVVTPGPPPE